MKISKVKSGDTSYITLRSKNGEEYCVITVNAPVVVEMNEQGNALSIKVE